MCTTLVLEWPHRACMHYGSKWVILSVGLLSISVKNFLSPKKSLTTFLHSHDNVVCFLFLICSLIWVGNTPLPTHYYGVVTRCHINGTIASTLQGCQPEHIQFIAWIFPHVNDIPTCFVSICNTIGVYRCKTSGKSGNSLETERRG